MSTHNGLYKTENSHHIKYKGEGTLSIWNYGSNRTKEWKTFQGTKGTLPFREMIRIDLVLPEEYLM